MSTLRRFTPTPLRTALKKVIVAGMLAAALPLTAAAAEGTFLVQLNDYEGHEAFFALYLVDPEGRFVKTLWVSGSKPQFHKDMARWWKYSGRAQESVDAITGASTPSGDRNLVRVHLDDDVLDKGYKVRVETAVENKGNYDEDVEVPLDRAHMKEKVPGTGYVRYLRYKWE